MARYLVYAAFLSFAGAHCVFVLLWTVECRYVSTLVVHDMGAAFLTWRGESMSVCFDIHNATTRAYGFR